MNLTDQFSEAVLEVKLFGLPNLQLSQRNDDLPRRSGNPNPTANVSFLSPSLSDNVVLLPMQQCSRLQSC